MKYSAFTILLLMGFSAGVYTQQPDAGGRPRRGLDQLDLLTVERSTPPVGAVSVDLETFKLLGPLIESSKKFEREFKEAGLYAGRQDRRPDYYETWGRKAIAVTRSILLIKEIDKTLSAEVLSVLDQNDDLAQEITKTLAVIRYGGADTLKREISQLFEQYGISESGDYSADRQLLVAAMIRRLNSNFARFTVAQ